MEQKDYLLREIEKIGVIINAIRQKIFGGNDNLAITIEKQFEEAKELLLNESYFDLDRFLALNIEESNGYICSFQGFNIENVELLADYFSQMGFNDTTESSKMYLEKALQLYDLCNLQSRTFSFERETKISAIRNSISC